MIQIAEPPPSRWILVAACAAAVACGQRLTIGTNATTDPLVAVSPSAVGGVAGGIVVPACGPGSEHPNVCCAVADVQSGQGLAATSTTEIRCGTYADDPFRPCPDGATTYPDPRACCDLADGGCTQPPPPDGGPITGCPYTCPPGYSAVPQSSPFSGGCCIGDPPTSCFGWSSNVVREEADGGSMTVMQTACACPPTFEAVDGAPDVCCGSVNGTPTCFSVGVGAAAALVGDAGSP